MEEWLLRQYFWRFVASTKGWKWERCYYFMKLSRSESLYILSSQEENSWRIEYQRVEVPSRWITGITVNMAEADIQVPDFIYQRINNRIFPNIK